MSTTNKPENPPAFPVFPETGSAHAAAFRGMTLRDWFAGQSINMPIKEVQSVSECDDEDLLNRFGTESEKEQGFVPVFGRGSLMPWRNIELRAKLEARARAQIRYAEADAMIAEREKGVSA